MNMISTGAFLPETDASTKQNELVKKLASAWEKKNSKTARAGGASLMALSLAACGGEDDTPFSAADVSAAEAAATTAALTGADGTVYASVDAAVTSNDTAIADAARAEGVASVDVEADNAAATDAAVAADTAFASLADLVAAYNALATPAGQSLALTSSANVISGGAGNDTISATSSTYGTGDVVIGGGGTDTLNIAATGNISAATSVTDVEVVNVNAAVFSTASYDATGVTGATITFNNTQTGGATSATVNNVGSNNTVVAGTQVTGTLTVDLTSTASGTSINAGAARIVTVTDAGSGGVSITQSNVGTSVSGTTDNEINVDGDGDAASDAATISSNGVVTLETATTDQVENLTLSGNTQAVTYTLDSGDAPEKVTFTGSQNVTLVAGAADVTTETVLDTTDAGATATLKINAGATSNLANVANSVVIELANAGGAGDTYSVADNATVKLTADISDTINTTVATNGTTETLNLIVDDTGDQTSINVADFEVVNISGSDTSTTVAGDGIGAITTLTGAATTTFYASGSTNLTLGSTAAVAKLIDASAMTGKLVTTMSTNSTKVYGGEGNDTITGWAGNMTVDGNGGSDTLVFAASTDLTSATLALSDLETVSITLAGAATLEINGSDITGESWIVKGTTTEDTVDITLDQATTDFSGLVVDDATIAVTYVETAVSGVAHTVTMTNADDTYSSAATAGAATINAGAGSDSITTGTGADTVNLGGGDDTADANTGANVLTGGDGNDVFVFVSGDSTETVYTKITDFTLLSGSYTQAAANDTIAEFQSTNAANVGGNVDILDMDSNVTTHTIDANVALTDSANGTANVKYAVTNGIITLSGTGAAAIDTLGEWIDEVEDITTGTTNEVSAFEFNGNTYVFQNAATDVVVELTGVTGVAGLDDIVLNNTTVTGGENYLIIA